MSVASSIVASRLPAEPFLLDAQPGKRFCIYHAPNPDKPCRGALIYVHPFAEEMNCSRRMAALQARALADLGVGVLLIDLYGCGDSAGEFGDARWEIWKADLMLARQWLESRLSTRIGLWGLRLGALLALDVARDFTHSTQGTLGPVILWQPVINGKSFITQFLRLKVAGEMLAAAGGNSTGTAEMRKQLNSGEMLEVAGYQLAPGLVSAIDALDAATLWQSVPHIACLHWFDIARSQGGAMSPATAAVIDAWRAQAVEVKHYLLQGLPFWTMPESPEFPDLLTATSAVFNQSSNESAP